MFNNRTYTTKFDQSNFALLMLARKMLSCEKAVNGTDSVIVPRAFEGQAKGHFSIPDGVRSVGYHAFAGCTELYSVYIPASVQKMDAPFVGCVNLSHIYFGGSRSAWEGLVSGWKLSSTLSDTLTVYCAEEFNGQRTYKIDERHLCPVCGKTMFPEENSADICPHCGWEDDFDAENSPCEESMSNGASLHRFRVVYREKCAQNPQYRWWDAVKERLKSV